MKKATFRIFSAIMTLAILATALLCVPVSAKEEFVPVLRFAVACDVHVKEADCVELQRLDKLFKSTYTYADSQSYKSVDAFVFCGDSANKGRESEWTLFNDVVKSNLRDGSEFMMSYSKNHEGWSFYNKMPERITGVKPFNSIEIKGFRFITVPQDKIFNYVFSSIWLKNELAKANAADPEKPIFVFQHEHIKGTVYGSDDWGTSLLTWALKKYPQVVDFSGHSHYPVNDPRSAHQGNFTSFGAGTLSYFELEQGMVYGSVPPEANNAAQFYIVEVAADNSVRVMPYNLLNDSFFENPSSFSDEQLIYTIDKPSDKSSFIYTDARAETADKPVFPKSAAVTASEVTANSAKITFNQATDGENIHSYRIRVTDDATKATVQDFKIWSEFYFVPMPSTLSYTLTGLSAKTGYSVSVTAIDSYGKTSDADLNTSFKTAA